MSQRYKELTLAVVLIFVSVLFWLSLNQFIPHISWAFTPLLVSTALAAIFLMIVWGLSVLLIESGIVAVVAWAVVSYLGLLWILDPLMIAGSTVLFLFGTIGFSRTKSEVHNTVAGGIVRPLRRSIPLTATALVAAFAIAAYLRAPINLLDVSNVIPEKFFAVVLVRLEPAIRKAYDPEFSSSKTVGDYVVAQIEKEGQRVPPALREQTARAGANLMSEKLGVPVKPEETLGQVFYQVGSAFIARQAESYKAFFPIAYALALFVTLRFIALFFNWIVIFIVFLTLKIFAGLGIIELRPVPTTIIEYVFR